MNCSPRWLLLLLAGLLVLAAGCDDNDDCPVCPDDPTPEGAPARTMLVPQDWSTIAEALAVAVPGDSVLVAGGTYLEYDLVLPSGLVLLGMGTEENPVVIDAQGRGRVMSCVELDSLVVLSGLTITGGLLPDYSDEDGAGLLCLKSRIHLIDCTIVDNRSVYGSGAGLAAIWSELQLEDCRFQDNSCGDSGGGVMADNMSSTRVENCTFEGNSATRGRGAFQSYGFVELRGCLFERNNDRAALVGDGSLVAQCTFRENNGGGLSVGDDCRVENCLFTDNVTIYAAGGVFGGNNLVLSGNVFMRNRALVQGGGADVYGENLVVENCDFIDNVTSGDGGGLNARDVVIRQSRFRGNEAETGGGIHAWDLDMAECDLMRNHAGYCAAFYSGAGSITGCVLAENSARTSTFYFSGTSAMNQCTIAANTVEVGGSVIGLGESLGMSACIVAYNTGSLIYSQNPIPVFDHCNLYGNSEGDWSGLLADQGALDGNFSIDPLFCDLLGGDFFLCADSPCLPNITGHDGIIGARDIGCVSCGE